MSDQEDQPVIQPPASVTVDMAVERKPLLWLPNGQALVRVRPIGFLAPKEKA